MTPIAQRQLIHKSMNQKPTSPDLRRLGVLALAVAGTALSPTTFADPPPPHGIVASWIGVQQLGPDNGAANVLVTNKLAVGDFRIRSTANRGDYDVQIGESLSDDVAGGVLITSVAEHKRDQGTTTQTKTLAADQSVVPAYDAGDHVATAHIEGQAGGSYFIPVALTEPNSVSTSVGEYNMNVAAGWFPYDKYIGAYIRNSGNTNGGALNLIVGGTQGLTLGTHFIDSGSGRAIVDLRTLGINSQTDGVLLVVGAKNEDNYALSQPATNGTWNLVSKDNGTDTTSTEQDPFAWVYIPKTNNILVSGRFAGDGTIQLASGGATPNFTVSVLEEGRFELKIPGYGPRKGVLLISPEGGGTLNRDNIVTYDANPAGDGWIIESRDLPNPTLPPLETPGTEAVASFVFIPGSTPGFVVTPTNNLFTAESGSTATFTVALETQPLADVTINVTSSDIAEGTVSPSTLTFTAADWNVPQTVTVTGVDDTATDGAKTFNVVLAAATSTDTEYNGLNPVDPTIVNIDNEGGITINPTGGLTTTEASGPATFTVRLTQAPTGDVTIGLSSSDPTEGSVLPPSLTFTSANWDQEQTVTITGVDDFIDDGAVTYSIITAAAMSTDPFFNGRNPADVSASNADDDTVGVTVTPTTGLTLVESAGVAIYTIALNSEPTADVVITTQSSDTTEGSISPTTFTFNAANWNVPKEFTITGVDDLVVDGNIRYVITNQLSSTDPLYAPIDPLDVSVTTLDDEAVLTLAAREVFWGIGMPSLAIAGRATIVDPNTTDYAGGTLKVELVGASAGDILEIRNLGGGTGQISVSGNTISYEGTAIGTFTSSGGTLSVNLNSSATPVATEALVRSITFRSSAAEPTVGARTATITLTDAGGAVVSSSATIRVGLLRVTEFQEGADHGYGLYTGAKDIELNEPNPDTTYPVGRNANGLYFDATVEGSNDGQVLLRFDNLVGTGPNQIPTNSIIVSAELFLDINESGAGSPFHRMLIPWDSETATWNTFTDGITTDDLEARSVSESQIGVVSGQGATTAGNVWVSVTPDVNAWVNGGATNYGWAFTAWPVTNSTSFSPSEAANVADRPRLRVAWLPKDSATVASYRQGVNDYLSVVDTRIREFAANANTDYSTTASVFVDAVASGTDPNQDQVLIRFDDIFGSNPNQIPPGAHIEAAVLDLASLGNDAVGDGAQFFALLQPWAEVNTWNGWDNGVQTNGVEAAATPTATVGNPTLNPDAQAGFSSFFVTPDVQAWANGSRTNAGWALIPWPGGGNGWAVRLSETANENERPRLRVYFTGGTVTPTEIRVDMPVKTATTLTLGFSGAPSTAYSLYRATTVDGAYTKVGDSVTTDATGRGTFTDSAPPAGMAFYKVGTP